MRALVTGATGFTGGHLARFLLGQDDVVRVMARDPSKARELAQAGCEVVKGDLTEPASLAEACAGIDVVYNIAALYREAGLPRSAYHAVNAEGPAALVRAAATAGVRRVVHCSTVGVHGDVSGPPANEDAPFAPGDVYQETKVEGERLAAAAAADSAARSHAVELVIVRPTGIYGPGDRRLFKLFGGIARGKFVMLGSGRNYYHLTYVDDLCAGFRLAGTVARAANRTYILGGSDIGTLAEIVGITSELSGRRPRLRLPVWPVWVAGALCEAACAPFGIEPPIYRRRVDFFRKSRAFDTSRARAELGFAPAVTMREGIRRTLEWYREHGWI
jgi:nucleoside-diphosphate-sugar epimerase